MIGLVAGLGFLILLFVPGPGASGHWPALELRLPVEALILAALAVLPRLGGRRLPFAGRSILALVILLLAIIGLVDAEAPALMGRELDFSADLSHAGSVVALFTGAAGPWQIALAGLAAILAPLMLFTLTMLALSAIDRGVAGSPLRLTLLLAGAVLAGALSGVGPLSDRALAAANKQSGKIIEAWRASHGERDAFLARLGAAPRRDADLARLAGRDVYVIFFESYGAVLLDPPLRASAVPAMENFGASLAAAGFTLKTARIASPTYGGGSWLAHGTVDSGAWLDSELRYELLTSTDRPTWPRLMQQAGYQTMDALPGLKEPLDSAGFWGFERMVGTDQLGYAGPAFGWFGVPDQFSLGAIEKLPRDPARPLFAQIVLVSSHMPFTPVPPYVEDWSDAGRFATRPELAQEMAVPPDWEHLERPYLDSVAYDLRVLADWIPRAVSQDALVILLGDHQPPALIGTASASHDVPVHILSRDPEIVRLLAGPGFTDGAIPTDSAGTMAELLPDFLDRMSSPKGGS
ncbi:MAG: hypothetical protein QOJ54_3235 [Aliidongia sp.]|nr:hypothetical protein [Aliidongia sp.]